MGFEKYRETYQELATVLVQKIFDIGWIVTIASKEDHPADLEDKLHCVIKYVSRMFETEKEAKSHARKMIKLIKADMGGL